METLQVKCDMIVHIISPPPLKPWRWLSIQIKAISLLLLSLSPSTRVRECAWVCLTLSVLLPSFQLRCVSCVPPTATNCLASKRNHISLSLSLSVTLERGRDVLICGNVRKRVKKGKGWGGCWCRVWLLYAPYWRYKQPQVWTSAVSEAIWPKWSPPITAVHLCSAKDSKAKQMLIYFSIWYGSVQV